MTETGMVVSNPLQGLHCKLWLLLVVLDLTCLYVERYVKYLLGNLYPSHWQAHTLCIYSVRPCLPLQHVAW